MSLPGYDAWKTMSGYDEDHCEFCGVSDRETCKGWQPDRCTGECNTCWRDPDAEYEASRDDPPEPFYADDY
jgi:hypothetical protein